MCTLRSMDARWIVGLWEKRTGKIPKPRGRYVTATDPRRQQKEIIGEMTCNRVPRAEPSVAGGGSIGMGDMMIRCYQ